MRIKQEATVLVADTYPVKTSRMVIVNQN